MLRRKKPEHIRKGRRGETVAAWHLRLRGYRILERNFHCRTGEIDIIAWKKNVLVFVEVRTRSPGSLQQPLETISPAKVNRTVSAAQVYLLRLQAPLPSCRFDVLGITDGGSLTGWRVCHTKNAFDTTTSEILQGYIKETKGERRRFGKRGKGKKR